MVILADDLGYQNLSTNVLLWESCSDTSQADIITGDFKKTPKQPGGPFLRSLYDRVKTHIENGETPHLIRRFSIPRVKETFSLIREVIEEVYDAGFPKAEIFVENFEGRYLNKLADKSNFFCSELLAYTLMKSNILSTSPHVMNYYIPKDFSPAYSDKLPLLGEAKFLEDFYIDRLE